MIEQFSTKLISDMYEDSHFGGYLDAVDGIYHIIDVIKTLTINDKKILLTKLSFLYYYISYERGTEEICRLTCLDLWDKIIVYTDTWETEWMELLTDNTAYIRQSFPDPKYFGNNSMLTDFSSIVG